MKALPEKFQTRTITAKCDAGITFTIEPISNQIRTYIQSMNLVAEEDSEGKIEYRFNPGGGAYDRIGFSVKDITGIDIGIAREIVKIGKRKFSRITDECIDRLPPELYDEILTACHESADLSPEEVDDVGFTPDSFSETSNAPETSGPVCVGAECLESEIELLTEEPSTT